MACNDLQLKQKCDPIYKIFLRENKLISINLGQKLKKCASRCVISSKEGKIIVFKCRQPLRK